MKVSIDMDQKDKFSVSSWWAGEPAFVVDALRKQLEAAAAIWPELSNFKIVERPNHAERGVKGGHARADSLTAEERTAQAKAAANARWQKK